MQKSARNLILDYAYLYKHIPLDVGIMYVVIFTKKSSIWGPSMHPMVDVLAAGAFFVENDAPGIFEHVYCELSCISSI